MNCFRVALFTTRASFKAHPGICSFLVLFSNETYLIDIFSDNYVLSELQLPQNIICRYTKSCPVDEAMSENTRRTIQQSFPRYLANEAKAYDATKWLYDLARKWYYNLRDWWLIKKNQKDQRLLLATPELIKVIDTACESNSYDFVIGLGHQGLILAHLSIPNVKIIYFSDELFYRGHPDFSGRKFLLEKYLEQKAFQSVALIIIQDEDRARFLFAEHKSHYEPEKVVFSPITWIGDASVKRSDFFLQRFPELKGKKILLQHGSLVPQRRTGELMKASRNCPNQYAMVFHGGLSPYLKNDLRKAKCWHSKPDVPLTDVEHMVAGSHIGLVFYTTDNKNDELIAHSSGQLAMYLKCGVPIIVNDGGSLAPLVRKWMCGVVVNNEKDIFDAADRICADYDHYCQQAVACFNSEYNLKNYYHIFIHKLQKLQSTMGN